MCKRYAARTENFIHRRVAGSHVLISVGANVANLNGFIELSESAALLWDFMKAARSEDELAACLYEEYEVDLDTAQTDVHELLGVLLENGMVTEV